MDDTSGKTAAATIFYRLATMAIIVSALYFGSAIFLPFALSVLLSFILASSVRRVERWGLPRALAVTVVSIVVGAVATLGFVGLAGQVVGLSNELPKYRENINAKMAAARETLAPVIERLQSSSRYIDGLVEGRLPPVDKKPPSEASPAQTDRSPLPAPDAPPTRPDADPQAQSAGATQSERHRMLARAADWLGPIFSPIATAAIVAVFTIFMLIEREDLRNRMIVLLGVDRVPGTTQLLDEAVRRVSRYLRMQVLINVIYGLSLAAISLAVGLPNAILWGAIGTVLRFIPYFGPILAAAIPIVLSVAFTSGWTAVLVLVGGIIVLELIVNNVLEPLLYGSSVGLSPFGVILSAFFWASLWGVPGLILATPLTACMTVLARHLSSLRFLVTLLGDDPPLSVTDRLYQRLLAGDAHEAVRIVEAESESDEQEAAAPQELLLAVLERAERDFGAGLIDRHRLNELLETLEDVTDEMADDWQSPPASGGEAGKSNDERALPPLKVLCLPGRGPVNAQAARLLALALGQRGWRAEASAGGATLVNERIERATGNDVLAVVLTALGPRALSQTRYLLGRHQAAGGHEALALVMREQGLTAAEATELRRAGAVDAVANLSELDSALRARHANHRQTPAEAETATVS